MGAAGSFHDLSGWLSSLPFWAAQAGVPGIWFPILVSAVTMTALIWLIVLSGSAR